LIYTSNLKALYKWAKENLQSKTIIPKDFENPIKFTTKGIKEYLNQPHKFYHEKNEQLIFTVFLIAKKF
jgi:hypothetical protein